jgi:hypothetical protein
MPLKPFTASVLAVAVLQFGWAVRALSSQPAQSQKVPSEIFASDPRITALEPSARGLVLKELDSAKANCETSQSMSNFFDCDCYVREVLAARLKAGTETQLFRGSLIFTKVQTASLVSDLHDRLGACVSTPKIEKWGGYMAEQLGMPQLSACVGRELAVRFRQRPAPNDVYVNNLVGEVAVGCAQGRVIPAQPPAPPAVQTPAPAAAAPAAGTPMAATPPAPASAVGQAANRPASAVSGSSISAVSANAQHTLDQEYFLDQTVSVGGEVRGFAFGSLYATITITPDDKTIVGQMKGPARVIYWRPSIPLSSQGITAQSLRRGDRVIVTGHPHRQLAGMILLRTITRPSDGWRWSEGASSTSTPPSTAASGAPPAPAAPPPAASGPPQGISSESGSSTNSIAALSGFGGIWWSVKRSGRGSDVYLPGHVAEVSSLTIGIAGDVMSVRRTGVPGEIEGTTYTTSTYRIDGGEHPFSSTRPNHGTTTGTVVGKRDGNRIVLDIKLQYGPRGARTAAAKRVFSLMPDGGLVIETRGEHFLGGIRQGEIDGTWVFNRPSTESSGSGNTPTPAPAARPGTTTQPPSKVPPERTETLAERQEKISKDVSDKTTSIVADLKKKSDAQLAQAAAASKAASEAAAQPSVGAQGQSTGAPAGPAWQPCGGDLKSGASQTAVPVEFVNTSKQPRKLIWFDFAGQKVLAGTLQPGQRAPMQTYTTHAWMIADGSDQCLGTLVISKAGTIEIR